MERIENLISQKKVLVVVGPTCSGKTFLSEIISEQIPVEIISADSRQIYKFMDIGTAKPSEKFRNQIPHYFIDIKNPDENFSAGEFSKEARKAVRKIFSKNKIPLIVGGTGLYIKSLIEGIFEGPSADMNLRKKFFDIYEQKGGEELLDELKKVDIESAQKMLPTNKLRIVRALEVFYLTGIPISKLQKEKTIKCDFNPIIFGINWERKILYENINSRVEDMVKNGLIEEVENLKSMNYDIHLNSLNSVGYKETFQFLNNEINFEIMKELIKQNTRRFAKRQMTWFNKDKKINWLNFKNKNEFQKKLELIFEKFC